MYSCSSLSDLKWVISRQTARHSTSSGDEGCWCVVARRRGCVGLGCYMCRIDLYAVTNQLLTMKVNRIVNRSVYQRTLGSRTRSPRSFWSGSNTNSSFGFESHRNSHHEWRDDNWTADAADAAAAAADKAVWLLCRRSVGPQQLYSCDSATSDDCISPDVQMSRTRRRLSAIYRGLSTRRSRIPVVGWHEQRGLIPPSRPHTHTHTHTRTAVSQWRHEQTRCVTQSEPQGGIEDSVYWFTPESGRTAVKQSVSRLRPMRRRAAGNGTAPGNTVDHRGTHERIYPTS